jgi:RNA polymerase sigma-70 factor (ECF subfamily)
MNKPTFTDIALLELIAKDSSDAFELLFSRYYSIITRVMLRYSRDPEQIKDWTQEIFVQLWENRQEINTAGIHQVKGYLIVIARNYVIKKLQKKKRIHLIFDELKAKMEIADNNLLEKFEEAELRQAYAVALARLPARNRDAYSLNREEGLTYSKVAEKLGVPVKTVESQISRALAILRRELDSFL